MFKEQFNSLYVAVSDFILGENNNPDFATAEQEITYYHDIVDQYNTILFNLKSLLAQLDTTTTLYVEVEDTIDRLNAVFDLYKAKSAVVRAYLVELDAFKSKITFAERLYRYEQSLVATPLAKIDVDAIQDLLVYARDYTSKAQSFYYFTNNPYQLDEAMGILIPVKYTFDTADKLLTSVYNYAYGLYNQYINLNKTELDSMVALESSINEKIYEFQALINDEKKNKYYATYGTTAEEYYTEVEKIREDFLVYHDGIVEMGVYRFYSTSKFFELVHEEAHNIIDEYLANTLYVEYVTNTEYDKKLSILSEYITLLEDGVINSDKEYIITDVNLKELVEQIIEMARTINRKIVYTQKYHVSGMPTTLEFEFYQTEIFLTSIKTYYYQLMTENIYRYSNLTITDFGDSTIDEMRMAYMVDLGKYFAYVGQEIDYMNDFEYAEYYAKIVEIQNKLKVTSAIFFDAATKTSPLTYIPIMEQQYAGFLTQLKQDLINIQNKRAVTLIEILDPNKVDAHNKLLSIEEHLKELENVLNIAKKYVFLGLNDYITTKIYTPFSEFFSSIKDLYNSEKFIEVITTYNDFYKQNIFDYNMLHSIERFASSVENIFTQIDEIDQIYVEEQVSGLCDLDHPDILNMMEDLFDDETYKVSRNEIFSQLDIMYEFIIADRPDEKAFLSNEKNLKKLYFDNQYMKVNYIRWYHKILLVGNVYKNMDKDVLSESQWYLDNKDYVENFGYKARLETLILNQNRTLSEITKMILDYSTDTNYQTVNVSSDIIRNIETYNLTSSEDIKKYTDLVEKFSRIQDIKNLEQNRIELENDHKTQWVSLIEGNRITEAEQVSYNEMETFTGSIPMTVAFEAQMETTTDATGNEIEAEYVWYFGTLGTKTGNKVTFTFYEEGTHSVRCEIKYSTGETSSRYLEFDLSGPQNSQIVKSGKMNYSPLSEMQTQPKITYLNADGVLVTVALTISGDVESMIGEGAITLDDSGDVTLDKTGLVILGFEGMEFAGTDYDYSQIFAEDFEMPTEAEFLFDFQTSTPIAGTATIDISNSSFTNFMAKLPKDITSVYEIEKASLYQSIGETAQIAIGDKLVLKNTYERYAIIEITNIITTTDVDSGKYYYEIEFDYFVNTSLNQFDRDEFKPQTTDLVIPTLVFKTDVREMFNSLIARLEEINVLRTQLDESLDAETYETIKTEIDDLEAENQAFYLFEELDKIKAKHLSLNQYYTDLLSQFSFDFTNELSVLDEKISAYKLHLDNTKTFEAYMCSINAYEFRKNIVDLKVMVDLYKDQQTILETIIDSYEYRKYDTTYYKNKVAEIQLLTTDGIVDESLAYGPMLVNMIKKLRELLFKTKIIINFPIMSEGRHIILSEVYYRLKEDNETGLWREEAETDLFMLNKKLELKYGYEALKVEAGNPYKSFIGEVIDLKKGLFGKGLSVTDIRNISNYIQVVETKVLEEYDDFFMIPFWIDYLTKNA